MANKKGLGEIDIFNIELCGVPLDEVKRKFRMPDFIANHPDWFDWAELS